MDTAEVRRKMAGAAMRLENGLSDHTLTLDGIMAEVLIIQESMMYLYADRIEVNAHALKLVGGAIRG